MLASHPSAGLQPDVAPVSIARPTSISFDDVYERHFRFVWRVLRASGVAEHAVEDAAQDVFVVVHRRLSEFEQRSDIRTWLFRIARWVALGERRRSHAKAKHEAIDDQLGDKGEGPFEAAARSEAVRTLEQILSRMDDDKRMAFLLMDIEEMKAHEVAELLEVNVNTVYSRLRLAREQWRRLLVQLEASSEGGVP